MVYTHKIQNALKRVAIMSVIKVKLVNMMEEIIVLTNVYQNKMNKEPTYPLYKKEHGMEIYIPSLPIWNVKATSLPANTSPKVYKAKYI